jgi:TorA maturation chaperone TorD
MKNQDIFYQEVEKGEVFRLLSEFYQLPNPDMYPKLRTLESLMERTCADALPYVAEMGEHFDSEGDIESLKVDFSKLFVGPFRILAPPYGSVYMEGEHRVMGDSTLHALMMYREAGVNISTDFSDAPDHIVAELEFIYYLFFKEIESIAEETYADAINYLSMRRAFLKMHLGTWVSQFALNVEKNAETMFYKGLAGLTKRFVRQELDFSLNGIRKFLSDRAVELPENSFVGDGPHLYDL